MDNKALAVKILPIVRESRAYDSSRLDTLSGEARSEILQAETRLALRLSVNDTDADAPHGERLYPTRTALWDEKHVDEPMGLENALKGLYLKHKLTAKPSEAEAMVDLFSANVVLMLPDEPEMGGPGKPR